MAGERRRNPRTEARNASHCHGAGGRGGACRPARHRGDGQPRRSALARPIRRGPRGDRDVARGHPGRADHPPRCEPCAGRGPWIRADRQRRASAAPRRPAGERFEGLLPPVVRAPASRSASRLSRSSASTIMSSRHHRRASSRGCSRSRSSSEATSSSPAAPRRQDHAGQCAAGRGRQDRRPRGADRGYARAAMRRARHPSRCAPRPGVVSLSDLVRSSLRLRPDRIPIGEVRGAEALDLLKAWGTGHPGGVGTLHAGAAIARSAASSNSSRKPSSPSARADRRDHRPHRGPRRPRHCAAARRARRGRGARSAPATTRSAPSTRPAREKENDHARSKLRPLRIRGAARLDLSLVLAAAPPRPPARTCPGKQPLQRSWNRSRARSPRSFR